MATVFKIIKISRTAKTSTITNALLYPENILRTFTNNTYTQNLFTVGAFHKVNHDLICKLQKYGIKGKRLKWCECYLK